MYVCMYKLVKPNRKEEKILGLPISIYCFTSNINKKNKSTYIKSESIKENVINIPKGTKPSHTERRPVPSIEEHVG